MQYVYSQLTRLDVGATYVTPDLAESWESDDTGQVWTFHLRQGVTFHDGSDFTSADVLYSIRRVLDPDTARLSGTSTRSSTRLIWRRRTTTLS